MSDASGLRQLEEQMDQYDQDRKRLERLLDSTRGMLADSELRCRGLQSEIARLRGVRHEQ